jgi:hypothetical protein
MINTLRLPQLFVKHTAAHAVSHNPLSHLKLNRGTAITTLLILAGLVMRSCDDDDWGGKEPVPIPVRY